MHDRLTLYLNNPHILCYVCYAMNIFHMTSRVCHCFWFILKTATNELFTCTFVLSCCCAPDAQQTGNLKGRLGYSLSLHYLSKSHVFRFLIIIWNLTCDRSLSCYLPQRRLRHSDRPKLCQDGVAVNTDSWTYEGSWQNVCVHQQAWPKVPLQRKRCKTSWPSDMQWEVCSCQGDDSPVCCAFSGGI